jgi:sulfur-oxidizing protein SoxA
MRRVSWLLATTLLTASTVGATPQEDLEQFRAYFQYRFPKADLKEFVDGSYALSEDARSQWEAIEEFPPYELDLEAGKALFETPFANGKRYADCFPEGGIGIRQNYPYYDKASKEVITLEYAINQCREVNGEKALPYKRGDIAAISGYMAYTSRGNLFDIQVPADDPDAVAWYEKGKDMFYGKRGQLNMACADCHVFNAGMYIRSELLSPAVGQVTHFPVYRAKWGNLGTLHRRYAGCNEQVRAKAFSAQSPEYRALEFFHTYMSNGLEVNGPGARK